MVIDFLNKVNDKLKFLSTDFKDDTFWDIPK